MIAAGVLVTPAPVPDNTVPVRPFPIPSMRGFAMVVYCPGCGAKISAQPTPDNPEVRCPRCQSTFNVEGVKPSPQAPPAPRLRKKKTGGGTGVGVLILVLVLLVLGGGTAGVLY